MKIINIEFIGELNGENCDYYFYNVDDVIYGTDGFYLYYDDCTRADATAPLTDRDEDILKRINKLSGVTK